MGSTALNIKYGIVLPEPDILSPERKNMGEKETSIKREYINLNNEEKIEAILGAVMGPVSKSLAIELSGIDYDNLDGEKKSNIDTVFERESVEITKEGEEKKYRLGDNRREALEKDIHMKSVHGVIAEKLMKEWESIKSSSAQN